MHLQGAGLLEKVSSGVYRITDQGRKVLAEQPERIDTVFLPRYPAYVEWYRRITARKPKQIVGPPDELETALLDRVREMSPVFFEKLILKLLITMGYGGGLAERARPPVGLAMAASTAGSRKTRSEPTWSTSRPSDTPKAIRSGVPRCSASREV